MFDQESAELLRGAPATPTIDPATLPRILTEAYSEIVTIRLRSNEQNLNEPILRLIEIGNTYESAAALLEDDALRKSAAFVAGSAYQILAKSLTLENGQEDESFTRDHVDGQISAALLFFLAEQYPDAKEAISQVKFNSNKYPFILQMLTESLQDFISEKFGEIVARAQRRQGYPLPEGYDLQSRATFALYEYILQGIELLSAQILSVDVPPTVKGNANSARDVFSEVLRKSSFQHEAAPFPSGLKTTYPGPAHLASLLISSTTGLEQASVMKIPTPTGADAIKWEIWLRHRAASKPILWLNHRTAIKDDFHQPGVSAAIVLPTGAGKTTLSEFKIAGVLASGKKVIFLAPTNALVEQLKTDLKESLPGDIFETYNIFDTDFFFGGNDALSSLEVMTPEKCLALLSFNPNAFIDVGLLVFDECHILSPDSGSVRRALDGMLAVLTFQNSVPDADFLFLSAMVKNIEEFAAWIESLTGRRCLAINLVWKPSRQARGIVLYRRNQYLQALQVASQVQQDSDTIAIKKRKKLTKNVCAPAGKLVKATPFALFGLTNNWHSGSPEDLSIKQLADQEYFLTPKFGPRRSVLAGPNGNEISRKLAIASANTGLKTIVFLNTGLWTYTSARNVQEELNGDFEYNKHELTLLQSIEQEFGSLESSMLYNMKSAVPHNADLIAFERRLAESLYRRPDGAKIIFATTTLSQGMNLPAQVAILSADERANIEGDRVTQEPLKAHELLNAAGRAGRAGFLANGLVLLVPRSVLTFHDNIPEEQAKEVLNSILPTDERCVTLTDPLQRVLDQIQEGDASTEEIVYTFHRLLPEKPDSETTENLLRKSFAGYIASKNGDIQIFEEQISQFKQALLKTDVNRGEPEWLLKVSIQSGISPEILNSLYIAIKDQFSDLPDSVNGWIAWVINWLKSNLNASKYCFGSQLRPLETISGTGPISSENFEASMTTLTQGLFSWIEGKTMIEIEASMTSDGRTRKPLCPKAREIVTNIAPRSLNYFVSLVVQITKITASELEESTIPDLAILECLPGALRYGFDRPEKLALYSILNTDSYLSRVKAHEIFNARFRDLVFNSGEDYKEIYNKMVELLK